MNRRVGATVGATAAAVAVLTFAFVGTHDGERLGAVPASAIDATALLDPSEPPRIVSESSPFRTPVPADPDLHPRSDDFVESLIAARDDKGFAVAVRNWTVPAFAAPPGTPRRDVAITAEWTDYRRLHRVPLPEGARPDPAADGHLTVIDRERGCVFDLWQARMRADGSWAASWGNATRLSGDGRYRGGLAARASGFTSLAGVIWPSEITRGRIDHALVFSYPHVRAGGAVGPATASDGTSTSPGAIPMGARVQLDPSLDLDSLDLDPTERTIARALQEYGMILGDSGGALSLYAAHPASFPRDPWRDVWPREPIALLERIPVEHMRVLAFGAQRERERYTPERDGCAELS